MRPFQPHHYGLLLTDEYTKLMLPGTRTAIIEIVPFRLLAHCSQQVVLILRVEQPSFQSVLSSLSRTLCHSLYVPRAQSAYRAAVIHEYYVTTLDYYALHTVPRIVR